MKTDYDFIKTESWWLKGKKSFTVEVKHWYTKGGFNELGEYNKEIRTHNWNVYIYVFPEHPFFDSLSYDPGDNYPTLEALHYGATFREWTYDEENKLNCKKYGSDYCHMNDERFERCDSENHPAAREIFFDAERLFDTFREAEKDAEEKEK